MLVRSSLLLAILAPTALLVAACDDGAGPTDGPALTVERVVVSPDSVEIDVFGEAQLDAVVYGPGDMVLEGRTVEWSSADTTLATVSEAGVITGHGVGGVFIVAAVEGTRDSAKIILTSPPITRVVATPDSVVVAEQRSKPLPPLVAIDALGREIARYPFEIGTSSDPTVASVDGAGVVTGHALGVASVVVRADTATTTVRIRVDPQWAEVHASFLHACALRADGRAYCWGITDNGRLGVGVIDASLPVKQPTQVAGAQRFRHLTVGEDHACGTATDGSTYCWGRNLHGTLGTGDHTDRNAPTPVLHSAELAFQSVTAGEDHTCALAADGAAYCWGRNAFGSLGIGTADQNVPVPTPVAGGHRFRQVTTASYLKTCALRTDGRAYCWGHVAAMSSAGESLCATGYCYEPVQVAEGLLFEELSDAYLHACGRTADREVYCWTHGGPAALPVTADVPLVELGRASVAFINCALAADASARCWTLEGAPVASALAGDPGLKWISTGSSGSAASAGEVCGIGQDDLAYCWDRADSSGPRLIPPIAGGQEP